MSQRLIVSDVEFLEASDYERLSTLPQNALDAVVGDVIGYPRHWSAFTVARVSAQEVEVSPGRYFAGRLVYEAQAASRINLTTFFPIAASDESWVALVLRGETVERQEERAFETSEDPELSVPVVQSTPKIEARTVNVVRQQGNAAPAPVARPDIAATDACIAFVRLTTQGVQEIEPGEFWRAKSLFEVEGRTTVLELQMEVAFQRVETITTDLANLQSTVKELPRAEQVRQLQRDAAQTRRLLNLPDAARGYFYDAGLVKDQWALDHPLWLARVDEGIRFPWAAERDARLEVLNRTAADIRIEDDILMPAWDEVKRFEVDGAGPTISISQKTHTVTKAFARQVARSRVRYGPVVAMCDNVQEWSQIGRVREGAQFQVRGETFQKIGSIDATYTGSRVDTSIFNQTHGSNVSINDLVLHNATRGDHGGREVYAARSVQVDRWTETYWDYVTEEFGLNGSIYGQTFLVTQPQVLTSIETKFTRVGDDDITMVLCEVSDVGTPRMDRAIAISTLRPSALKLGWVRFPFKPTYLDPGRRYAWVTVTTGNHALQAVRGNKFAQGSMFFTTDGAWFQGSTEEDFAFRLNGARFRANRAVVEFSSLTLENGMAEIDLIYPSWSPDGTSMMWEVMPSGSDVWKDIRPETDEDPNPLVGLPAQTRLRLTMMGTTDLAPAIVLSDKARATTKRPRPEARPVTKTLDFGYSASSILVEIEVDQFDPALHAVAPRLIVGDTTHSPATVSTSRDLSKSTRRKVTATFNLSSATASARLLIGMTTTTVQRIPFLERAALFAL